MQSDLIRIFSDQNESMLDLMTSRFVWLGRIDGRWLRTEECTRRPYFDSGKILQLKKPVINNFSTFFLNYFKNISRWWDETCSKPLLVLPAPYFSGSNDKWLRWLGPQFWNQKRCLSQQSPGKGDISDVGRSVIRIRNWRLYHNQRWAQSHSVSVYRIV